MGYRANSEGDPVKKPESTYSEEEALSDADTEVQKLEIEIQKKRSRINDLKLEMNEYSRANIKRLEKEIQQLTAQKRELRK